MTIVAIHEGQVKVWSRILPWIILLLYVRVITIHVHAKSSAFKVLCTVYLSILGRNHHCVLGTVCGTIYGMLNSLRGSVAAHVWPKHGSDMKVASPHLPCSAEKINALAYYCTFLQLPMIPCLNSKLFSTQFLARYKIVYNDYIPRYIVLYTGLTRITTPVLSTEIIWKLHFCEFLIVKSICAVRKWHKLFTGNVGKIGLFPLTCENFLWSTRVPLSSAKWVRNHWKRSKCMYAL